MRTNANGYSEQISFFDIPRAEPITRREVLENILYARVEGKEIVFYFDKEAKERWSSTSNTSLAQKILSQTPCTFTNESTQRTFERVEWL